MFGALAAIFAVSKIKQLISKVIVHSKKKKIMVLCCSKCFFFLPWNTRGDFIQNIQGVLFHVMKPNGAVVQKAVVHITYSKCFEPTLGCRSISVLMITEISTIDIIFILHTI